MALIRTKAKASRRSGIVNHKTPPMIIEMPASIASRLNIVLPLVVDCEEAESTPSGTTL